MVQYSFISIGSKLSMTRNSDIEQQQQTLKISLFIKEELNQAQRVWPTVS